MISLKSKLKKLKQHGKDSQAKTTSEAPGASGNLDSGDNNNDDNDNDDKNLRCLVCAARQQFAVLYCAWVDDQLVNNLGFIHLQINLLDGHMHYANVKSEVLALQAKMWDLLAKHCKIRERLEVNKMIANNIGFH
jgi:hypothetical protein